VYFRKRLQESVDVKNPVQAIFFTAQPMRENDLHEVASSSLEVVHAMFRESPVENTTHFDRFERSYLRSCSYRVNLYTLLLFDDLSV